MARNIEIKARIESTDALRSKVARLADRGPVELVQDDWFFRCAAGRLKLRVLSAEQGELIFYQRPDQPEPKESSYSLLRRRRRSRCARRWRAYSIASRVRKRRTLFMIGRTRVHLDRMENLGDWLDLEVVLEENEPSAAGIGEAQELMAKLGHRFGAAR